MCMFITTANTTDTIPRPLLDRMEVIELASYTDEEKLQIAKSHLLPKQMKEHGLNKGPAPDVTMTPSGQIIPDYTRESGVRVLERQAGRRVPEGGYAVCWTGAVKRVTVTEKDLPELSGRAALSPRRSIADRERGRRGERPGLDRGGRRDAGGGGQRHGRHRQAGAHRQPGRRDEGVRSGGPELPPQPGASSWAFDPDFYKNKDIHVHFPEGAVPKDGPSAGIAIATAMLSALTDRKVKAGHRHDRRDHPAGPGAAHRRTEGKDHGGPAQRHPHGADPRRTTSGTWRRSTRRSGRRCSSCRWSTVDQVFDARCSARGARRSTAAGGHSAAFACRIGERHGRRPCGSKGGETMPLNFNKAEFVRSAGEPKDFLRDGLPQFAFAGRSNVGKSSVINRLVGRKNLAYVGASPGKTTHINYFLDRPAGPIWWICRAMAMPRSPRLRRSAGRRLMETLFPARRRMPSPPAC